MKTELKNLIEDCIVSEPEIVDLLSVSHKLVTFGFMEEKKLDKLCDMLGVVRIDGNTFELEEGVEYTFNLPKVS